MGTGVIHWKDVIVPENRQRRIFDDEHIGELARDLIEAHGLLHPIVLRDDGRTLVAGECRLRAVAMAEAKGSPILHGGVRQPLGHVPFICLGQLSPEELEEAELAENVRRKDISWQELVDARARLVALRKRQNPETTQQEIAAEILSPNSGTKVKDVEVLAANLHRPAVAAAPSATAAMKILTKELENEFRAEVVRRQEAAPTLSSHTIIHGSMVDELPKLADGIVDCLITDPPYGVNAQAFGDQSQLDHEYCDDPELAAKLYEVLAQQAFRIAKPFAHAYVFLDFSMWDWVQECFLDAGWDVWNRPLIWAKGVGIAPQPFHGPRKSYECILYANKGKRPTTGIYNDVLDIPAVKDKGHAAQKPVELYRRLIQSTCAPGEVVLDPFAGSGTVFPAANLTHTRAIGIELSRRYYELAFSRMNGDE